MRVRDWKEGRRGLVMQRWSVLSEKRWEARTEVRSLGNEKIRQL